MRFYVYQLRATDEEQPFYIGKSFEGSNRYMEHKGRAFKESRMVSMKIRSILKRGDDFLEEVLYWFDVEQDALDREIELISKYGRRDNKTGILCNHTNGGEGTVGMTYNKETRKKMSDAKMGHKLNLGRKRPDMVEKFSKPVTVFNLKGEVLYYCSSGREAAEKTGVHFGAISDCCVGRTKSCRSKKDGKVYRFKLGKVTKNLEPIKHRQSAGLGVVQQFTREKEFIAEYRTSGVAMEETGVNDVSIRNCVHGKQKLAGGYIWKLKKEKKI